MSSPQPVDNTLRFNIGRLNGETSDNTETGGRADSCGGHCRVELRALAYHRAVARELDRETIVEA
jgi:hypothetical protein